MRGDCNTRVLACIIKTAQSKASSEDGKFSAAFAKESTSLLVNSDDLAPWNFKERMNVHCTNQDLGLDVVLAVKASRFVRKGTVNLINSPWISSWIAYNQRSVEIELESTTDQPYPLETLYNTTLERPA